MEPRHGLGAFSVLRGEGTPPARAGLWREQPEGGRSRRQRTEAGLPSRRGCNSYLAARRRPSAGGLPPFASTSIIIRIARSKPVATSAADSNIVLHHSNYITGVLIRSMSHIAIAVKRAAA